MLVLFVSCGKTATNSETPNDTTTQIQETQQIQNVADEIKKIEFEIFSDSGTVELVAGEEGSPAASFKEQILVVTEVPSQTNLETIQAVLQKKQDYSGDAKQALAKKKKNYLEGYIEMNSEEVIGMSAEWYRDLQVSVIFNDNYFTTIAFYLDEYGGGAHPYYTTSFINLDLKNSKQIKLSDIFDENSQTKLKDKMLEKASEIAKKEGVNSLEDYGFFVEEISPTENFAIIEKGIEFSYNRGEITPHVMPSPVFFFTWQELESIVNTDSPIRILMK